MKRWIKASKLYPSTEEANNAVAIANEVLRSKNCAMNWEEGYEHPVGILTRFNGDSNVVKDGMPYFDGYAGYCDLFFFNDYAIANPEKFDVRKEVSESISRYLVMFGKCLTKLKDVVTRIPEAEQYAKETEQEVIDYFTKKGYASIQIDSTLIDKWGKGIQFYAQPYSDDEPKFKFNILLDGSEYNIACNYTELASGQASNAITSEINKKIKRSSRSATGNNLILQILKSHGIDTTRAKYELCARTYDRMESGEKYIEKFTCPGDYLAYFSMHVHANPTLRNMQFYFGEDLSGFEDVVDENPALADIEEYASSNWWGDGDDYIIYLKNLNTGEYLYENEDPYYDSDNEE